MHKVFKNIHLWLSVPFGLIIMLTCFSGAMLVWEPEIHRACNHELYYVSEVKGQAIPTDELKESVAAMLPDSVEITRVEISDNPERAYQMSLSKPRHASIFVDQYTGQIKGDYVRSPFFKNMFFLHRWLLDGGNPKEGGVFHGKLIVGISTLMFVIVLISGIVMWVYRARKSFRRSLSISAKNGKTLFFKGLHVAGGMYAAIFLLACALTGLTWSFDWYRTGFYKTFGVEQTEMHRGGEGRSEHAQLAENKQGKRHGKQFGERGGKHGNHGDHGDMHKGDKAKQGGDFKKGEQKQGGDKMRSIIYAVHTGTWGGLVTRIITFLAALFGATLPLTGYYLWIKRLRK
jgi:uncharacterized iron-regulated membrane protein